MGRNLHWDPHCLTPHAWPFQTQFGWVHCSPCGDKTRLGLAHLDLTFTMTSPKDSRRFVVSLKPALRKWVIFNDKPISGGWTPRMAGFGFPLKLPRTADHAILPPRGRADTQYFPFTNPREPFRTWPSRPRWRARFQFNPNAIELLTSSGATDATTYRGYIARREVGSPGRCRDPTCCNLAQVLYALVGLLWKHPPTWYAIWSRRSQRPPRSILTD